MNDNESHWSLEQARLAAMLSMDDLWLRYISLGGLASASDMESFVTAGATPNSYEHDLLAQALNERFIELGRDMPVRYSRELA